MGVSASGLLDDCVNVRACECFHFSSWIAASSRTVAASPLTSCSFFPQAAESSINGESGGRKASEEKKTCWSEKGSSVDRGDGGGGGRKSEMDGWRRVGGRGQP